MEVNHMCMCLGPSRIKLLLIICSIHFHRTCIRVPGFQQDKSKNTKSKNHLKVHPETMGNCIVLWANLMEAGHWEHKVWRAQYRRNDADWKESFCEMKSAISGEKEAKSTQSQEKTQANFRSSFLLAEAKRQPEGKEAHWFSPSSPWNKSMK